VHRPRRPFGASRVALETLVPPELAYRRSLTDEVAIDFPSSPAAIDLFTTLTSEDDRQKAAVYMDGLSQMRSEWAQGKNEDS